MFGQHFNIAAHHLLTEPKLPRRRRLRRLGRQGVLAGQGRLLVAVQDDRADMPATPKQPPAGGDSPMQGMSDATRQTMAKIRSNLPRFTRARLYLFVFVLVQSPVAYTPGLKVKGPLAKQPIVPLQAVARDLREARDGTVRNATIAEHVVSLAALPGNLVRMSNLTAPNGTRPNVTYERALCCLTSARSRPGPSCQPPQRPCPAQSSGRSPLRAPARCGGRT